MREDPSKGFFVENIKEETLVSVEHALSVIAAGDAHRKVKKEAHSPPFKDCFLNKSVNSVDLVANPTCLSDSSCCERGIVTD